MTAEHARRPDSGIAGDGDLPTKANGKPSGFLWFETSQQPHAVIRFSLMFLFGLVGNWFFNYGDPEPLIWQLLPRNICAT